MPRRKDRNRVELSTIVLHTTLRLSNHLHWRHLRADAIPLGEPPDQEESARQPRPPSPGCVKGEE